MTKKSKWEQLELFTTADLFPEYVCPQCSELWVECTTLSDTIPAYHSYGCANDHYWIHFK